jgi:hypothetical protein
MSVAYVHRSEGHPDAMESPTVPEECERTGNVRLNGIPIQPDHDAVIGRG